MNMMRIYTTMFMALKQSLDFNYLTIMLFEYGKKLVYVDKNGHAYSAC